MHMIQSLTVIPRRLALALAVGLIVFSMAFLVACGDDQDTAGTEEPQPTATPAAVATDAQPTQQTPRSTATPASTDSVAATPTGPAVQAVATSNIVADWVEVIGGDRVEVFGLVPAGSDPHSYMPGARDVAKVEDADVVFTVGLGLEATWLADLVHNASADESKIVALGEGVDPLEFSEEDAHDDHMDEGGDDHGGMLLGRLLIGDGEEGVASVIDLRNRRGGPEPL